VAGRAGQVRVIAIEPETRVLLVVEYQLAKALAFGVALSAVHALCRTKLPDVRIGVA
jgi:hypothetical protein